VPLLDWKAMCEIVQIAGRVIFSGVIGVVCCLALNRASGAESETPQSEATFRITFNGNDITNDWVVVAQTLLDSRLVETRDTQAQKGDGLCAVANRALGFNDTKLECSKEMVTFLSKLNPDFLKKPYANEVIYFPNLPIASTKRVTAYDKTVPAEQERYIRATSSNGVFLIKEGKQQLHNGIISLAAYRSFRSDITVPDTATSRAVLASLVKFDDKLGEFTVSVERIDVSGVIGSPYSLQNLSEWWEGCVAHTAQGTPPSYVRYLGLDQNPSCEAKCEDRLSCPAVFLFDRSVSLHPALLKAMHVPLPHPANSDLVNDQCPTQIGWNDSFHGTHLAGIIASDDDPTLGAAPGISPHVWLNSIDSLPNESLQTLKEIVGQRDLSGSKFSIFVVASKLNDQTLVNPALQGDLRFINSDVAQKIRNAVDTLWVVAAGQASGSLEGGTDLSKTTMAWPMNLGDLPNVIVVTACEHCLDANASIPIWANYSTTDMVTVAAPGGSDVGGIPAPISDHKYARQMGTSQATAFVAGLAAELAACHPGIGAKRIKLRLELTARPFFAGISKVASGAIDQKMAMLDPEVSAIKPRDRQTDDMLPVVAAKWCLDQINAISLDNQTRESMMTARLRRLVRVDYPGITTYGFWAASLSHDGQSLEWRKYPIAIDDKNLLAVKYDAQDSWHTYRAQDVEDFILGAGGAPLGDCQ